MSIYRITEGQVLSQTFIIEAESEAEALAIYNGEQDGSIVDGNSKLHSSEIEDITKE